MSQGRTALIDLPPLSPPLVRAPLDSPLVLNGSFGEARTGHFHAGVDLGTGGTVGRPVYAPLSGWIERVRTSGAGYGRSLYLRADDERLLVFAHLDAFETPLASYVQSWQDSTARYEQDLWPEREVFRVAAGQRIAWSGQSGAGGPHLHFEIRRGDLALNPFRAGLSQRDVRRPTLTHLTLEPLDDTSFVEGGAGPHTLSLSAAPETVLATGRLRAVVGARDGLGPGRERMAPWAVRLELEGASIECRFDSASWATDMAEADYVYDGGRVVGKRGIVMWAPAGFRPVVLNASAPLGEEAGTITLRPGEPPRRLRIEALDVAGNSRVREVVLRTPPRPGGPKGVVDPRGGRAAPFPPSVQLSSLPGGWLRVRFEDSQASSYRRIALGDSVFALSGSGGARSAVIRPGPLPRLERLWLEGGTSADSWRAEGPLLWLTAARGGAPGRFAGLAWEIPEGALFEPSIVAAESLGVVAPTTELSPVGSAYAVHPVGLPLRKAIRFRLTVDAGQISPGVGLYQDDGSGWRLIGARVDSSAGTIEGEARALGRLCAFRDSRAPRISRPRAPRGAPTGEYSRWALEAGLFESGSGVDRDASYFEVNGRRVPSEWDAEEKTLRWRPLKAPAKGSHRYQVVATDRAGNTARYSGTFVLD